MYGYIFIVQMRAETYETASAPLENFTRPIDVSDIFSHLIIAANAACKKHC